jgi:hypothetical protein
MDNRYQPPCLLSPTWVHASPPVSTSARTGTGAITLTLAKKISLMENIAEKHDLVTSQKFKWGAIAYFNDEHKDYREWDSLGRMASILHTASDEPVPVYAVIGESPDFAIYDSSRSRISGCEVTEVIKPGYARHRFHKEDALKPPGYHYGKPEQIDDQWEPLTMILKKKASKSYSADSWLLVYYDIGMLATADWETPFHVRLLAEFDSTRLNLADDDYASFARILVLSPDMRSLTEIHPNPRFIGAIPNEEG